MKDVLFLQMKDEKQLREMCEQLKKQVEWCENREEHYWADDTLRFFFRKIGQMLYDIAAMLEERL